MKSLAASFAGSEEEPTLVIHADADRIVPFSNSGKRRAVLAKGSKLVVIAGRTALPGPILSKSTRR